MVSLNGVDVDKFFFEERSTPARISKLQFSNKKKKFPKNLTSNESKAYALHCFANHELLAIEIMAVAIARFNKEFDHPGFIQGIIGSMKDEQKHLQLYINRINELGYEFGDFPLNDFFWKYVDQIKTPAQYISLISLTFESANLDFAYFYAKKFNEIEDEKTSRIMMEVYEDEISHVRFGEYFLGKWRGDKDLWNYYLENLIHPITPARAKGIEFNLGRRQRIGLNNEFQEKLHSFDDKFRITNRKCNITSNP